MKRPFSTTRVGGGLVIATALAGCSATPDLFVRRPVGPAPGEAAGAEGEGRLRVYSARYPGPLDFSVDAINAPSGAWQNELFYLPAHRNYLVQTSGGAPCRYVENATDGRDATPADVTLPAGRYLVLAPAEVGDGSAVTVTVPVTIAAGRTTIVHLETDWHPAGNAQAGTEFVWGSDGRAVGWAERPDGPALTGTPWSPPR